MKMTYIQRIQAGLKIFYSVAARKKTGNVMDGSYKSIYKGKSMNFDELREYVVSDDAKDIDWKASARSRKLLVRQYIAEKKHNVMFIMDTAKRMLADSRGLCEKRDLAIMGAGTLAYLCDRNGDYINAVFSDKRGVYFNEFKSGHEHLERLLEKYYEKTTVDNQTDLNSAVEFVLRNYNRKMIVILVTDYEGFCSISDANIKRLMVSNDVLVLGVSDADIASGKMYDFENGRYFDDFILSDKKLMKHLYDKKDALSNEVENKLTRLGIASAVLDDEEEIGEEIIYLLNKHKWEK